MNLKESERYRGMGNPMDRAPPGPKTNRDHLMKDKLALTVRRPLTWQRGRQKVVLPGIEPRDSNSFKFTLHSSSLVVFKQFQNLLLA